MIVELTVKTDVSIHIDTDKIISISDIYEHWVGKTNMKILWYLYKIQFLDNQTLDITGTKKDLGIQRNKLIEFWNKDKKEIPKI